MTYEVYHDLSCEKTEEVVKTFLHKKHKESDGDCIKFSLSHSKEREVNPDDPSSEGDLEENLYGP